MRIWIAVWTGSTRICTGIAGWLLGGGAGATFGKLALVLFLAGFAKGLPWTTHIALLLGSLWLLLAVVLGLRVPVTVTVDHHTPDAPGEPDGQPPPPTREQLARALHKVGSPHAHITALAEHLGTSNERVREGLAAAAIPVSGGVRMKGRPVAVSPGVKGGDFPPLPSPAEGGPQEGVLTSNNNSNNTDEPEPREGMSIIQDKAKHNVWHVKRRARS